MIVSASEGEFLTVFLEDDPASTFVSIEHLVQFYSLDQENFPCRLRRIPFGVRGIPAGAANLTWCAVGLPKVDAVALLRATPTEGAFLVRGSESCPHNYVLSYVSAGAVHHALIRMEPGSRRHRHACYLDMHRHRLFDSLQDLVAYFSSPRPELIGPLALQPSATGRPKAFRVSAAGSSPNRRPRSMIERTPERHSVQQLQRRDRMVSAAIDGQGYNWRQRPQQTVGGPYPRKLSLPAPQQPMAGEGKH